MNHLILQLGQLRTSVNAGKTSYLDLDAGIAKILPQRLTEQQAIHVIKSLLGIKQLSSTFKPLKLANILSGKLESSYQRQFEERLSVPFDILLCWQIAEQLNQRFYIKRPKYNAQLINNQLERQLQGERLNRIRAQQARAISRVEHQGHSQLKLFIEEEKIKTNLMELSETIEDKKQALNFSRYQMQLEHQYALQMNQLKTEEQALDVEAKNLKFNQALAQEMLQTYAGKSYAQSISESMQTVKSTLSTLEQKLERNQAEQVKALEQLVDKIDGLMQQYAKDIKDHVSQEHQVTRQEVNSHTSEEHKETRKLISQLGQVQAKEIALIHIELQNLIQINKDRDIGPTTKQSISLQHVLAKTKLWAVPGFNADFYGRTKELNSLNNYFNATGVQVIAGMGGLGKSQLALRYIELYAKAYDAVIWLDSETQLKDSFAKIARHYLGYSDNDVKGLGLEELSRLVQIKLNGKKILWVFDNVNSQQQIQGCLPQANNFKVLITTRNQYWPSQYRVHKLGLFDATESSEYIAKALDSSLKEGKQLAEHLGYLPLAIVQATAYIKHTHLGIEHYLNNNKLFARQNNEQAILALWRLALERLSVEAKQFIQAFSFLSPEGISVALAKELIPEELLLAKAFYELQQYSLIRLDKAHGMIYIHRLTQHAVRAQMPSELKQASLAKIAQLLKKAYTATDDSMQGVKAKLELLPHFIAAYANSPAGDFASQEIVLTHLGAIYTYIKSEPKLAIDYYTKLLELQEKRYGTEHDQIVNALNGLGSAYASGPLRNPQKQKELLERALKIREKHSGPEHYEVAGIIMNLGNAYGELGNQKKKKELLERSLKIKEKHYGPEHYQVANTLTNLSNVYGALGNKKKQKELLERSLKINEKHYGPEHYQVGMLLYNLSLAEEKLGKYQIAFKYAERVHTIFSKHYGTNHGNTQKAQDRINNVQQKLNSTSRASLRR